MTQFPLHSSIGNSHSRILVELNVLASSLSHHDADPALILEVVDVLDRYRAAVTWQEWREFAVEIVRQHPLVPLLHQEPSASYGFRKPRGYAGDAVLMDFGYGGGSSARLLAEAGDFGRALYRQIFQSPWSVALRERRDYLAKRIEESCSGECSRILAVACGHLRELQKLSYRCWPDRFVAIDQDGESLLTAQADLRGFTIEYCKSSAFRLLTQRFDIGSFDFIYSAGLYDYLDDQFGARLLAALAKRLAPGGVLLVANMLPGFGCAAYMEAVMDWWLIYRSAAEMMAMARGVVDAGGFSATTFTGGNESVVYLEIRRERSVAP